MIPALLSFLGGVIGNVANSSATRRNNATNIQLARERNAMQQSESQLAYERSKPTTQVNNLMSAGMSKAGALSTLNGGGSYTPAPIQSAKTDAAQVDTQHLFDGLMTTWENNKSRKSAEDMQAKQIEHDRRTHARDLDHQKELKEMELESQERIAQMHSADTRYGVDRNYELGYLKYKLDKDVSDQITPAQVRQINATVDNLKASANLSDKQAEQIANAIAEYNTPEAKDKRKTQRLLDKLQTDLNYKITNKGFEEFLKENYTYNEETGEYELKDWISNANNTANSARVIWQTIFEIVPVNQLLEALGGTIENVRALKLLSKVK